ARTERNSKAESNQPAPVFAHPLDMWAGKPVAGQVWRAWWGQVFVCGPHRPISLGPDPSSDPKMRHLYGNYRREDPACKLFVLTF
ncbi:hypothetical protein NPIL_251891, partial [Nephila pilipes]